MKIGYYLSHPIQYFSPLLSAMNEKFKLQVYYFSDASVKGNFDKGFRLKVKWDIPLLEGYHYTFLHNLSPRKSLANRFWDVVNPGVITTLVKNRSHVVIVNGWSYFSTLLTIFISKILGKKIWLRAESPLNQELRKNKLVLFTKKIIFKYLFFPFINQFLYIGSENKRFLEYYGVSSKKMIYTPYAVDNNYLRQRHLEFSKNNNLKEKLNLPLDKKVILFVGKFIEKKRPIDLIKAFQQLKNSNSILIMVGEGELRNEMESYIKSEGINGIILTGFINQFAIPEYYELCDVFVMCSGMGETWGLAVNEAMNFEKPIIVSKTCGCSSDLIQEGINGFSFTEGNVSELSFCIDKVLGNEDFCKKAGKASGKIILDFSIDNIVTNLVKAGENMYS